ncbi:MAG: hypothetical protein LAT80_08520 [Balneolaceae bacterium]|nr:hypothetical protein [Balneolaceae bacterium]
MFLIVIFFMTAAKLMSQSTSVSVMEVRVEVVAGVSIATADTIRPFDPNENDVVYGEFEVNLPEGVEIVAKAENKVKMVNGTTTWTLNSELSVVEDTDGRYRFTFITRDNQKVDRGIHRGIQTATIEYI